MKLIQLGNIVTLDNGREYLLIQSTIFGGNEYVYCAEANPDDSLTGEHEIFRVVVEPDGEYLADVFDLEKKASLLLQFETEAAGQKELEEKRQKNDSMDDYWKSL